MMSALNSKWYIFGISHKKADYSLRRKYALSEQQISELYKEHFPSSGCTGFILSTCNRTCFFLLGGNPKYLEKEFIRLCASNTEDFEKIVYRYTGNEALLHFYEVGGGLDSQIPGDFEIIGQMKRASVLAKNEGLLCGALEKLLNSVIYTGRRIKNETSFSTGTASVSYAGVRFLRNRLSGFNEAPVLLLGLGEIGVNVLENLIKHKDPSQVYITNRSDDKSHHYAKKYQVNAVAFSDWKKELSRCRAFISAASVNSPLLMKKDLDGNTQTEILIDLGMLANIDPAISPERSIHNVDHLSDFINETLNKRNKAMPQARQIIKEELAGFMEWQIAREASPLIKAISKLFEGRWKNEVLAEEIIVRMTNRLEARLFTKLKTNPMTLEHMQRWINKNVA